MSYWAHSENDVGEPQGLEEHLEATAEKAAGFSAHWGGAEVARTAGLLHDLGKASQQFQDYVRGKTARGGDHSSAGAYYASGHCDLVSLVVAGHHAGLSDPSDLKVRLQRFADTGAWESLAARISPLLAELDAHLAPELPPGVEDDPLVAELFTRMIYSALVDADFLDTERHLSRVRGLKRGIRPTLSDLWEMFSEHQERLVAAAPSTVTNRVREEVYRQCLAAADQTQGIFSLTVPTGGGKTLSSLGFALRHALRWDLKRVIVVIPYTSIIEQTADVYRGVLGPEAVLEHHSAVDWEKMEDEEAKERAQLASENWDAPVVVTTAVQFLESLFSNRSSHCRKLHNIADSVVILDEVQTVPTGILRPTLEMLVGLTRQCGVTAVLSTATHPAYHCFADVLRSLEIREIMPDPASLFRRLQRVEYVGCGATGPAVLDWEEVASAMGEQSQAMTVVNTKRDAQALFAALPVDSRLHLSTNLCGAHRREVLATVRQRLHPTRGKPCHLSTTQLVEAGVDLDFPVVYRAIAPLDRLVQAAGRCNREGRWDRGRVVLFEPRDGGMPPGVYKTAVDTTAALLRSASPVDLHDPKVFDDYFARLYQGVPLDPHDICRDRARLKFATVAANFRVIEGDTVAVAVPWKEGAELLAELERRGKVNRDDWRALQPYLVSLRLYEHQAAVATGRCREIAPSLWLWEGGYHDDLGIVLDDKGLHFLSA